MTFTYFQFPDEQMLSDGGVTVAKDGAVWSDTDSYANAPLETVALFRLNGSAVTIFPSTLSGTGEQVNGGFGDLASSPQGYIWDPIVTGDSNSPYDVLVEVAPKASQTTVASGFPSGSGTTAPSIDVATAPNGSVWSAAGKAYDNYGTFVPGQVGYESPTGQSFTNAPLADASEAPMALTLGPDGTVWVAETHDDATYIDRYSMTGSLVNSTSLNAQYSIAHMVTGPDRNVWFTSRSPHAIGKINAGMTVTAYPLSSNAYPNSIAVGGDGALWFTAQTTIGRITTAGSISTYTAPTVLSGSQTAGQIAGVNNNCGPTTLWVGVKSGGLLQLTISTR